MSQPSPPPPAAPAERPPTVPSARVRLGRLALEAALAVPGIVRGHPGRMGLAFTNDGGERLQGVVATALADGRVGVELHLEAELVPLRPLGDAVRAAVASRAGSEHPLGPVDVRFEDVSEPGEVATRPSA